MSEQGRPNEEVERIAENVRHELEREGVEAEVRVRRHEIIIRFGRFSAKAEGSLAVLTLVAFGFVSMVGVLIEGFKPFFDAVMKIFGLKSSGLLISTAFAQSGGNGPPSIQVLPIVVYAIYLLLSVGYIVSLFYVFKAGTPKSRSDAMEILKTLTAFFIGAISGKAV
jgi:hypothetical protein